jgi:beta-lactamase regulating signal transducer with metallopeptidase domain
MASIIKALLEITLMASAMIAAVMLIRRAFAKKMSPAAMLVLWGLVLLRLCLPVTFASPVSVADLFPKQVAAADSGDNTGATLPVNRPDAQAPAINNNAQTGAGAQTAEQGIPSAAPEVAAETTLDEVAGRTLSDMLADIPWWSVFAAAWITGTAATLCLSARKARRFRKRLCFCRPISDRGILETIRRYQQETGVRKAVSALECDFIQAPAVFGYFTPRILIPSRFVRKMDRESLGAILLHEMIHIRRHDILMNYIWLLARALHWFNPLVWIACKRFGDDVELCRDEKAAQRLDAGGDYVYTRSLVEAARFSRQGVESAPSLASSLFESRGKLKERVTRLTSPRRKTKTAAFVSALLACAMVFACFTTACQPTPTQEIVIGRQQDVLSSVSAVPSEDFQPIVVTEHISEVCDDLSYVKITYDADVIIPDATAYPVTEVNKRVFTEKEVLSYIDLFTEGDYEMYAEWILTKDDYLSLLTKAKQYEGTERVTDDIIKRLQELYDKAKNDIVNTKIESFSELPAELQPSVNIKNENGVISSFSFDRNSNYCSYSRDISIDALAEYMTDDSQYEKNMDGPYEHFAWKKPGEPEISQEDAYAIALECREALGADLDLYSVQPCSFIKDHVDKTTGWQFLFTRKISGLQTLDTIGTLGWRDETAPSYGSPWGEEQLIISVDKDGLFSFWWKGASQISRTVAESAKLLDFDSIKQRITDQLSFNYAFNAEENGKYEIEISEIRLGISMISMENRTDIGEYLPTWYVSFRYKPENLSERFWKSQQIMFNAVDGSYIEPRISVNDLMGNMDVGEGASSSRS